MSATINQQLEQKFQRKPQQTGAITTVNESPRLAPVVPLDDLNDPIGMHQQGMKFAEWALQLPHEPLEITLKYGPFDAMPREWEYRVLRDDEPQQMVLWLSVYDIYFQELQDTAQTVAIPPEDDDSDDYSDGPNWKHGLLSLLIHLEELLADLQTDYLARCYEYLGWDAEAFLEESDAYMNPLQQRLFLQGYMYMYELERVLREQFDDLSPIEQEMFPPMYEAVKQEYADKIAALRAEFDASMDDAITKMLDGDA